MKNSNVVLSAIAAVAVFSLPAQSAMLLGAKAGADFWYADTEINNLKADDTTFQQSYYVAVEHFIPLIPNGKLRYTGVKSSKLNTDFSQYDVIAYYEILDNDLIALDIGLNFQNFNGHFLGMKFNEWQPNLYSDVRVGIPATPISLFGSFSYGTFDETSTVDTEAGAMFTLDLIFADINFKAGYRIQDYDFNYFPGATSNTFQNNGFFAGVEFSI